MQHPNHSLWASESCWISFVTSSGDILTGKVELSLEVFTESDSLMTRQEKSSVLVFQIPSFPPNLVMSPWGVQAVFSEVWSKTWLDATLSTLVIFEMLWTLSAWLPSSSSTLLRCHLPSPLVDFWVSLDFRNTVTQTELPDDVWLNKFQIAASWLKQRPSGFSKTLLKSLHSLVYKNL